MPTPDFDPPTGSDDELGFDASPDDVDVDVDDPPKPEELEDIPADLIELHKIPPRLWEQTLAPLHRQQRYWVAQQIPDARLREVASELASELDFAEVDRRNARAEALYHARRTGYPLPTPNASHAVARPTKQLNVRVRLDDHDRLAQAATAVGLKPTTLARALVLNGAARILQEHAGSKGVPIGS